MVFKWQSYSKCNLTGLCSHPRWKLPSGSFVGSKLEIFDNNGYAVYKTEVKNRRTKSDFIAASGVYLLRVSSKQKVDEDVGLLSL